MPGSGSASVSTDKGNQDVITTEEREKGTTVSSERNPSVVDAVEVDVTAI
jgi:hypothetical protein